MAETKTPGIPVLEARGIGVALEGRRVLGDVDLRLDAGEIASIDGPSGSGKSTLLRALALLQEIDRGAIFLEGAPASQSVPTAYRVRVAYVPQLAAMFAGTVQDNVRAGPRLRGIELASTRVLELLAHVAIDPSMASRDASALSGGERQRVAIARAIANEPRVILFDEPTASLDPTSARTVLDLVRSCASEGRGVIVVTHSRAHAEALGGTRYTCEGGRLTRREPA